MSKFLCFLLLVCPSIVHAYEPNWFDQRALNGNAIKYLPDGKSLTEARLELIAGAKESIYLSAYAFQKDAGAMEIAEALCARAKEKIDVRLIVDHRAGKQFAKKAGWMRKCGARVIIYNALDWGLPYFRETLHEKLFIVDGLNVVLGGSGYSNWYKKHAFDDKDWHDLDVQITGPAACWYHYRFQHHWRKITVMNVKPDLDLYREDPRGEERLEREYGFKSFRGCKAVVSGNARVYPLQENPFFDKGKWILKTHLEAIKASTTKIELYSPYFVPHGDFVNALVDAAKRGVDVSIITNSDASTDEGHVSLIMFRVAERLMRAGAKVYIWNKSSLIHRKGGIYDGRWAWFGSDNLDRGAHVYNAESIAFTDDAEAVRRMKEEWDGDLASSTLLTHQLIHEVDGKASLWRHWVMNRIKRWL